MKNTKKAFKNILLSVIGVAFAAGAEAEKIAQPTIELTDKYGVSINGNQITTHVDTLAIGGAMGLTHSFATHTNNFLNKEVNGPNDKFWGVAMYTKAANAASFRTGADFGVPAQDVNETCQLLSGYDQAIAREHCFYMMKVNDSSESVDFKVMARGTNNVVINAYATQTYNSSENYTYEALRDTRHTLVNVRESNINYLVWTKPDGTEVWYERGLTTPAYGKSYIKKIVSPNGFTLTIHSGTYHPTGERKSFDDTVQSVTTNTGFQLRYNYMPDMSDPAAASTSRDSPNAIPDANPTAWALENPKTIVGINNSIDYCNPEIGNRCVSTGDVCLATSDLSCTSLTKRWPTARFDWPQGMPHTFFVGEPGKNGESVFKVTDALNKVVNFRIKAFDTALDAAGNEIDTLKRGVTFVPRLVGISSIGNAIDSSFKYTTIMVAVGAGYFSYHMPGDIGALSSVRSLKGASAYNAPQVIAPNRENWVAPGTHWFGNGIHIYDRLEYLGSLERVNNTLEGIEVTYEPSYRAFPVRITSINEPTKTYGYDIRNNLDLITINGIEKITATYPNSCTDATRKICNQAKTMTDAKGNITTYTYHTQSGQVETVTLPNGAQTRYEYTPLTARYLNGTGGWENGTPIYLKTAEKSCANSAFSGSGDQNSHFTGSCANNDEIVTRYEYNSNNLLLTGMTVMAADTSGAPKTLRTCYRYDIYGNQIGKTQPKANLASCN